MREVRDLAEGAGGAWLGAGSPSSWVALRARQLGILAVLRGGLDEARALLDEALERSRAACSLWFVTLCLTGHAQLALAVGDPQRAARLEGAAAGLRRRVGLSAWPPLRRMEADLVAQIRQRLGAGQFDQAFSAGSQLTQREAVAIARN